MGHGAAARACCGHRRLHVTCPERESLQGGGRTSGPRESAQFEEQSAGWLVLRTGEGWAPEACVCPRRARRRCRMTQACQSLPRGAHGLVGCLTGAVGGWARLGASALLRVSPGGPSVHGLVPRLPPGPSGCIWFPGTRMRRGPLNGWNPQARESEWRQDPHGGLWFPSFLPASHTRWLRRCSEVLDHRPGSSQAHGRRERHVGTTLGIWRVSTTETRELRSRSLFRKASERL